jgi:hypothetical protein
MGVPLFLIVGQTIHFSDIGSGRRQEAWPNICGATTRAIVPMTAKADADKQIGIAQFGRRTGRVGQ